MGNKQTTAEPVLVPPIAPFLDAPIECGSPQRYILLQLLGNGAFGRAYVAVLKRDLELKEGDPLPSCREIFERCPNRFVIKRFRGDLDPEESAGKSADEQKQIIARKREMFIDERRSAAWIKTVVGEHENLLSYKHDIADHDTGTDAMVFEFCNCGDIRRLVSGCKDGAGQLIHLTLFEFLTIANQLTSGLAKLAEAKIVHRDLALRNIFVHINRAGDLVCKIGDFGLCVDVGDGKHDQAVRNGLREAAVMTGFSKYDQKSDVYQLGLVLYGSLFRCSSLIVCAELLSLIDLSSGTLYQLNTTSLAEARVLVKGSIEGLSTFCQDYKDVSHVVGTMLSEESDKRPSATLLCSVFSEQLSRIPSRDRTIRPLLTEMAKTSATHTQVQFPPCVGVDRIISFDVRITSFDALNRPRLKGGDHFALVFDSTFTLLAALHPAPGSFSFNATVTDHKDGTYTARVRINGEPKSDVSISVLLDGVPIKHSPYRLVARDRIFSPIDYVGEGYVLRIDPAFPSA